MPVARVNRLMVKLWRLANRSRFLCLMHGKFICGITGYYDATLVGGLDGLTWTAGKSSKRSCSTQVSCPTAYQVHTANWPAVGGHEPGIRRLVMSLHPHRWLMALRWPARFRGGWMVKRAVTG